jgi:hypothetical protein
VSRQAHAMGVAGVDGVDGGGVGGCSKWTCFGGEMLPLRWGNINWRFRQLFLYT